MQASIPTCAVSCAPTHHDLLRRAIKVFDVGEPLFAAAGARIALGRWLGEQAKLHGCPPQRHLMAKARELLAGGHVGADEFAEIRSLVIVCNKAAHGGEPPTAEVVATLAALKRLFGGPIEPVSQATREALRGGNDDGARAPSPAATRVDRPAAEMTRSAAHVVHDETAVLGFFEEHFVPEHLGSKWTRVNRRAAILALGKFLKREPLLADLTADTLDRFTTWLRRHERYAPSTVRSRRGAIHSIWTAAHECNLAGEPPRQFVRKKPWEGKRRNLVQYQPAAAATIVASGEAVPGSLAALVDRYQEERDVAPSTVNQIRYATRRLADYLGRPAVLADFADSTINKFLLALQQTKLAASTIRNDRRNLLTLWRLAFEAELVDELPKRVRKIKIPRKLPEAWTLDELRALVAAAAATPGRFSNGVSKANYLVAFIACGFFTALRLGDLLALTFDQIENSGWLTVTQQKTGYPIRCHLPPDALRAVAAIRRAKQTRLFAACGQRVLQNAFARIVKRAGLKGTAKTLRKTAATLAECEMPGSASWLLGHRDPSLARRSYIDPRQVQQARPRLPHIELNETAGRQIGAETVDVYIKNVS